MDFAVGFIPQLITNLYQLRLFQQSYVCIYRQGHPIGNSAISLDQFAAAEHVAIDAEGTGHSLVEEYLASSNIQRNIRLTVPHFVTVGHILAATDLISILPKKLAEKIVEPFNLCAVTPPVTFPEIQINLFWHAKFHNDPANKWLRALIHKCFSE